MGDLKPEVPVGIHRLREAFKESVNLVGLSTAAAVSAALLTPLPLLAAIVAETCYLMFVPDSKWYMDRLEKKYDDEVLRRREELKAQILPQVRKTVQDRFARLEDNRRQIGAQSQSENRWFREALRKLDFLLEKYLLFASKQVQFTNYLNSVLGEVHDDERDAQMGRALATGKKPKADDDEDAQDVPDPAEYWVGITVKRIQDHYTDEIAGLDKSIAAEPDPPTRAVMEKRKEVLNRRFEYVGRIGLILTNLGHQMQLMSDAFGLINDEIRARSPEQVLADIDEVVMQTNSLTEAIEAVTPLEDLVARM